MGIRIETDGSSRVKMRMPGKAIPEAQQRKGALGRLDAVALSEFRKLPLLEREKLISDARLVHIVICHLNKELNNTRKQDWTEPWLRPSDGNRHDGTYSKIYDAMDGVFECNREWKSHREGIDTHDKKSASILQEIQALVRSCNNSINDAPIDYAKVLRVATRIIRKSLEKQALDSHYEVWCRRDQRGGLVTEHRNQI